MANKRYTRIDVDSVLNLGPAAKFQVTNSAGVERDIPGNSLASYAYDSAGRIIGLVDPTGGVRDLSPLLAKNTIIVIGDSFVERSMLFVSGAYGATSSHGIWLITNMLLKSRFKVLNIDGVSGSTSAIILGRLPAALALKPKYAFIPGTINDILSASPLTYAQSIANYSAMFKMCNEQGTTVITSTLVPFTALDTTAKRSHWNRLNAWLMNEVPALYDAIVMPSHYQYLDPDLLTCQPVASQVDSIGVHPLSNGAFKIAKSFAAVLSKLNLGEPPIFAGVGAGDDAGGHPNPLMVGTTGTLAVNITGVVATSLGVRTTSNLGAAVCSKVARTDGPGYWQQIVYTPSATLTADSQSVNFYVVGAIPLATAGMAVGDEVSFMQEFEVDASNGVDFRGILATLYFVGPNLTIEQFGANTSFVNWGDSGFSGVIETPRYAIPTGTTGYYVSVSVPGAKASTALTVRLGNSSVRNYTKAAV